MISNQLVKDQERKYPDRIGHPVKNSKIRDLKSTYLQLYPR
jgi:hypothetical protein